jgi:hypothetical protein
MIDAESNVILRRPLKRLGGLRPFPLPRNAHRHAESTSLYGPTFTLDNLPIERLLSINGGAVAKRPGPLINSPGPIRFAPCSL